MGIWSDQMTQFDGKSITYDEIGNVVSYDGYTYDWEKGRQLSSITGNGLNMSFEYNSSGLRTKKVVGDKTIEYYYSGDLLVAQYDGTNWIKFVYAPNGEVIGFSIHDDSGYYDYCYYLKNVQGDIVGIYSMIFAIFRQYTYDAWGNITGVYDENGYPVKNSNDVAYFNPLRYRGYYYDDETGLYYLNSRYYNPEWGVFISADGYVSTGEQIVAKNMYAYCLNNPVNYSDPSGTKSVDIDLEKGLDIILDIFEFAIQTTFAAAGYSYDTAVRPSNIGAGVFNKQVAQAIEKNISRSLKVTEVFDFLGWLTLAIDCSMIVIEHIQKDQTKEEIAWDVFVDVVFTGTTFAASAKLGEVVGTFIGIACGPVIGAVAGVATSLVTGLVCDYYIKKQREKF